MNENLEEDNEAEVIQPAGIEPDEPREEPQGEPEPAVHAAHVGRTARSASGTASASFDSPAAGESMPASVKPERPARRGTPRARRMNLSVTHISAWSAAKVSFLLTIAGAIIQIVAVALIWLLLDVVGVFQQITQIVSSTGLDAGGINLNQIFSLGTVLSAVTIFSIVEVVLITLLVTIITLLYNVVTALVGGVHVTLGDD